MNEGQKTVIYSWLHVIATTLKGYDIDSVTFLKQWDIDYDATAPHEARVPTLKVFRALNHAAMLCNDEAFGIKLAKNILPTMFHGLTIAAIASENAISAIRLITNNFHVICESVKPTLFKREQDLIICLGSTDSIVPPTSIYEAFFAALKHISEEYMGLKNSHFSSVHFTRSPPLNPNLFGDFFDCKIHYEEAANYAVLKANELYKPIPSHNPLTKKAMLELINSYQEKREQKTITEMVTFSLKTHLFTGQTDLKQISHSLHMSSRTLQSRLHDENASFREIVEKVQLEVSNTLMITTEITIEQLAQKFGYNSSSNFCRAYKKWSGTTPVQYRRAPYGAI